VIYFDKQCVSRKVPTGAHGADYHHDLGVTVAIDVFEFYGLNRAAPWSYEPNDKIIGRELFRASPVYSQRIAPYASRLVVALGYYDYFGRTGNLKLLHKPHIRFSPKDNPGAPENHHGRNDPFIHRLIRDPRCRESPRRF
jgi:hypothetical protein